MTETDASHLSIGEVLSLLQEEFPDVTISKIRFLESQGLIDPERTPSGYRKFYESDVERLRWILQQQRDHFLPLKVIKDRLIEADRSNHAPEFTPPPDIEPPASDDPLDAVVASPDPASEPSSDVAAAVDAIQPLPDDPTAEAAGAAAPAPTPTEPESVAPVAPHEPAVVVNEPVPAAQVLDLGPTDMTLTADELSRMSGLSIQSIDELQGYGLLVTRQVGADRFFDGDAVVVARTAAKFAEFGVETRHLRMYKVSSEREAGFFEQVIMPLLKQRNPASRQRAIEQVGTMASLGQQLHAALLRQALDDSLG